MGLGHQQSIASLAVTSRNVELASRNTQLDVQAIAGPVRRMDKSLDLLLRQREDTPIRLLEMQVQMRQYHDEALNLSRTMSDQYRLLLQQYRTSSHGFQHDLNTALVEHGTERELLRSEMRLFNEKREAEAKEAAARMDVLVRTVYC